VAETADDARRALAYASESGSFLSLPAVEREWASSSRPRKSLHRVEEAPHDRLPDRRCRGLSQIPRVRRVSAPDQNVGEGAQLVAPGERCDRHAPFATVDGEAALPRMS